MMASVWISPSSYSCTSERRRVRRVEGKAVGLEAVVMVLLEVSVGWIVSTWLRVYAYVKSLFPPLFCAPQTSQVRYVLRLVLVSRRLPQSVQKTRDPMAAIFATLSPITWKKKLLLNASSAARDVLVKIALLSAK
jgi:hypothetical protein